MTTTKAKRGRSLAHGDEADSEGPFTRAELAILDPDALDDEPKPTAASPTPRTTSRGRGYGLVGSGSMRAPQRHHFGRGERGEAKYNEALYWHRFHEATEGEIDSDDFERPPLTDEERAQRQQAHERVEKARRHAPKQRQYNANHAARWPAKVALANARRRLKTSMEALAATQELIDALPALKTELAALKRSTTDVDRLLEVERLVGLEGVRWKSWRKSRDAIAKWAAAMPGLEAAAAEEDRLAAGD